MRCRQRGAETWSRRAFLSLLPAALPGQPATVSSPKGTQLAADWGRYPDPSTEFEVLRLTNAAYESQLPAPPARAVTRRSDRVLFASARTGSMQAHLLELRNGRSRVLTEAAALDPATLTLAPDDRFVYFFDGPSLKSVALGGLREQTLGTVREGYQRSGCLAVSDDGRWMYFVETREGQHELRRLLRPGNAMETIVTDGGSILAPAPNPRRDMVLWLSPEHRLWVATIQGGGRRAVETPPGRVRQALWSPDGQAMLYLLEPEDPRELVQIREQEIDARADRLVAKTSQFAAFGRNADGSVFLGASRNKAAPSILALLRATRRELTLCEHKAADPFHTAPIFAPSSQRIFFQSDRDGSPALYSMLVDKLIEKTDT